MNYIVYMHISSKVLLFSSSTFLISSYYGYHIQNSLYKIDLMSTIFSILYWYDSENKYKRMVDVAFANIAGVSFFVYGVYNMNDNMKYVAWCNLVGILSNFSLSCIYYKMKYDKWFYFHFLFHMFTLCNKLIIYNY